ALRYFFLLRQGGHARQPHVQIRAHRRVPCHSPSQCHIQRPPREAGVRADIASQAGTQRGAEGKCAITEHKQIWRTRELDVYGGPPKSTTAAERATLAALSTADQCRRRVPPSTFAIPKGISSPWPAQRG